MTRYSHPGISRRRLVHLTGRRSPCCALLPPLLPPPLLRLHLPLALLRLLLLPRRAPAAPPPVPTFEERLAAAGLTGTFEIQGVLYHPAFQLYMQGIKTYTPEWAQEITTIPAPTIRRLATEFANTASIGSTVVIDGTPMPLRPVCIQGGRGAITQFNGGHLHCAIIIVNMLVGALDVPGGGRGELGPQHKCTPIPMALKPDADGTVAPKVEAVPRAFEWPPSRLDGKTFFPYSHDNPHIVMDAILDPAKYKLDYTPEVMLAWGGNMVLRVYQQEKAIEALKKFKFIFALSYSIDEPALMADIVLPESGGLERIAAGSRGAMYQTKGRVKARRVRCGRPTGDPTCVRLQTA